MSDNQKKRRKSKSNEPKHKSSQESNNQDSDSHESASKSQKIIEKKKIFGFQIFIDNDILNSFQSSQGLFHKIQQQTKTQRIKFNPDLTIPDLQGKNVQIYDKQMEKKYQSAKVLLSQVYQKFKKIKNQSFSIIIFVPEGMVSLLIGTKGHQINKIMKQSKTIIVVNQPINRMTYRTVKIQGNHHDIAKACCIIYQILEQKSSIAYSIEKQPSPLDYTKAKVKAKFIFASSVISFLQNKKKVFLKRTQDQTKSSIRFKQDNSRLLKRDQDLCILVGKLEDVQAALILLLTIIHDYYVDEKSNSDYTLKMLIPSNYVTKLIGQKGYMIRDIIERSGGSQIKILSEKQSDRDSKECIISINGTRQNKIDSSCLILQQIQCFKNGGPILQSGKSINQNLAQQFKNSIPLRPQQEMILEVKQDQFFQEHEIESQKLQQGQKPKELVSLEKIQKQKEKQVQKLKQIQKKQKQAGQIKNQHKKQKKKKQKSSSISLSDSKSRSRSRQKVKKKKQKQQKHKQKEKEKQIKHETQTPQKRHKSKSKSPSQKHLLKHDKDKLQIKIIIPKKLAADYKELRYLQQLSNCEIIHSQQKLQHQGNETIIIIKGSIKQNNECMRLLQKRIARFSAKS